MRAPQAGPASAGIGWQSLLPSWPLILGLFAFGRLLAERMALLNDPDTYLHIAAGRWILAHGALPVHDPFSHSVPGAAWLPSEWLAQIVFAATYAQFGWGGVILVAAASVALAVAVLTHFVLRQFAPLPGLIVAAAAAALLLPHALARPHVLALPLLALWAGLLLAARDAGRPPPFAALPVIVLWANLHASFMFGLALAAFLAGEALLQPGSGRSRRAEAWRWGAFLAAALVAALLTPSGLAGLLQPIRLIGMPALQSTFTEWRSPDFQTSPVLELWIVGLLFVGFAAGVRLPLTRLVLLLGLVHMTLQHVRHADLLALVGPLALAAPLGRSLTSLTATAPESPLMRWAARLARPSRLPATAVALLIAAALALPTALRPIVRGDDPVTPASALTAATRLGLAGPVFNSQTFGGYLIFRGLPSFIDGRIEMYGNDFLARDYRAERGDAALLNDLLARYGIAWTLLLPQSGAVSAIDHLPGWERVYADQRAVIHRRIAAAPR
ncbi:MAG TPA: hypothetical protein VGQ90_03380 [Stellaceae bacterium]|jgi:hypothetical protein|nr:hypothetical protein [Stellaceae bacterium]